jgi:ubiquinone/menaquinone biosynthesis C-methylase UbiE
VPYDKWADRAEAIFAAYEKKPKILLDLACGTGSLTKIFADRGYDVIGADASAEMLSAAAEKVALCENRPLLLNQAWKSLTFTAR